MNEVFISRVRLRPEGALHERSIASGAYGHHQLLWNLFAHERGTAPFLYRAQSLAEPVYVVSSRAPVESRLWDVETKPYAPKVRAGESLSFTLRASATVCRGGKRHDIVVDRRFRDDARSYLELANEAFPPWLSRQGQRHGFDVETVTVTNWDREKTSKRGAKAPIQFTYMDCEGVLTVKDPESFAAALVNGIGRAKAFGCGLMMVRRLS